jgi:hypothetical protein
MGRKSCYSRTYSGCCAPACAPACGPICPPCGPFFGPCCPPPCGPFLPPCCPPPCCPPCYDDCYYDSCCDYKSSFTSSSIVQQDVSSSTYSGTVTFTELTDCAGEFNSNVFTPRCPGCYKFCSTVQIQNTSGTTGSFNLNLVVGTTVVYQTPSQVIAPSATATFTIDKSITLKKGESVSITASNTSSLAQFRFPANFNRTFSGKKLSCKSSCNSHC